MGGVEPFRGLAAAIVSSFSWPPTSHKEPDHPPERINTCYGSNGPFDYTSSTTRQGFAYTDYYEFKPRNAYPGQGNDGWRNFQRFLPPARLIAAQPLAVQARPIAERWWQFNRRSEPRWRAARWKAKT